MNRKDAFVALRLTEEERSKIERIAQLRGCSMSEAVRLLVRGTQVKMLAIHEIAPSLASELFDSVAVDITLPFQRSNASDVILQDRAGIAL